MVFPEDWNRNSVKEGVLATIEAKVEKVKAETLPDAASITYKWYLDDEWIYEVYTASATGAYAEVTEANKIFFATNAVKVTEGVHTLKVEAKIGAETYSNTQTFRVSKTATSGQSGINTNIVYNGGLIIYDKGSYIDGWRYIEVFFGDLNNGSSDEICFGYERSDFQGISGGVGDDKICITEASIGKGKENTIKLFNNMGNSAFTKDKGLNQ